MNLINKNAIANYMSLGYVTILNLIVFPLYLKLLGTEAFGLIGFYLVTQSTMLVFDMGLSPMLSRQIANARGKNLGFLNLKKLLKSLELFFLFISFIIVFTVVVNSYWLANNWLHILTLEISEVKTCIILMILIVGTRFFYSLYRSGLIGLEKQVRLNIVNILLVTLKVIGSLLILLFVTKNIVDFFIFQFIISLLELFIFSRMFYYFFPLKDKVPLMFYWKAITPVLPFTGGIAYATIIWVLLTQLDKIILSNILSLADYGYFTLVIIVTTGLVQLSNPLSQAILPRMTFLLSQGKKQEMIKLYRQGSQFIAVIMFPITGVVALFSTEILYIWSNDLEAAKWSGSILFWFSLGNGVLAVSSFQYYLQYAYGKLKLHVIFNSIQALLQIPLVIYAALEYGAIGVAISWFILRVFSFFIWTPIIHKKFAPGIHLPWLLKDIFPMFISTFLLLFFIDSYKLDIIGMTRLSSTISIIGILSSLVLVNALVSNVVRKKILLLINTKVIV